MVFTPYGSPILNSDADCGRGENMVLVVLHPTSLISVP